MLQRRRLHIVKPSVKENQQRFLHRQHHGDVLIAAFQVMRRIPATDVLFDEFGAQEEIARVGRRPLQTAAHEQVALVAKTSNVRHQIQE